jgi:hypothetical protein
MPVERIGASIGGVAINFFLAFAMKLLLFA